MERKGYVAAVQNHYEACRFHYRPLLPEAVELIESGATPGRAAEYARLIAKALATQVVRWDEVDDAGQPVSITYDNVRRLLQPVFLKMWRIVSGLGASDADPLDSPREAADNAEVELAALLAGSTPAQVIADKLEKN
jgi:hypothetical protein